MSYSDCVNLIHDYAKQGFFQPGLKNTTLYLNDYLITFPIKFETRQQ
jgi:hypothetical protein